MTTAKRLALPVVVAMGVMLGVTGCASMSEAECRTADWRTLGFEDGAAGQPVATFSERRQACADHGVQPNILAYRAGRNEGLALYCTEGRGFQVGRAGGRYAGVCPAGQEAEFRAGFEAGRVLYRARRAVDEVADALKRARREREQIADDIAHKNSRLVSDEATRDERVELLAEVSRLRDRDIDLVREIEALEDEQVRREAIYRREVRRASNR